MAVTPFSLLSPFSQTFERFLYDPVTNWQRFFNPQFIFNYNPQDEGIERYVLSKVGSYGSQLSTLLDTIEALRQRIDKGTWTEASEEALKEFDELHARAEAAVDEYRGRASADEIVAVVEAFAKRDPDGVAALGRRLEPLLRAASAR